MTPDSLSALSDTLFSITVALYSLAVVAFCAQLAFGRRTVRTPELVAAGGEGAAAGQLPEITPLPAAQVFLAVLRTLPVEQLP